eukprot:TRINITY_DN453_c0_g1_i1.p1 TRINITY_DN453_c0_g1~~TRINITY_DN453_c0_g1_i1.p1  ORF type:complete len:365 (+),score=65.25 TRINITY_DN453_c0_g1_i1:36-1097(+)
MENSAQLVIKRKPLLIYLLEALGLSFLSFLVFYLLSKLFTSSVGEDHTSYQLEKERRQRNATSVWAGEMPVSASEILDIFNYPDVYSHFGSHLPKGILLYGRPGTGKTHFARIIAELTGSAFFYASASQFDEVFVGRGAQRVRNLFQKAYDCTQVSSWDLFKSKLFGYKVKTPQSAVIFIDELDAIGSRKSVLGHSSQHGTVSQLLTCLDGIKGRGSVFVIGATNNLDLIDPALRRSGRFDKVIEMPMPNKKSRIKILLHYLKDSPGLEELQNEGVIDEIGDMTEEFSCADMENLAKEAIMIAVREAITELKESGTRISQDYTLSKEHLLSAFEELSAKVGLDKVKYSIFKPT